MNGEYFEDLGAEPGQRVICVDAASRYFTEGKIYEVSKEGSLPAIYDNDGESYTDTVSKFVIERDESVTETFGPLEDTIGYPDNNPKTLIGTTKPPTHCVPPVAILMLGQAMKDGKEKYGLMNWREHPISSSVYFDAAMRHLLSWWDGEEAASDSGVHHLAHAMACFALILDAQSLEILNDDRPYPGRAAELIKGLTDA